MSLPEVDLPSLSSLFLQMSFGEQELATGTGFIVEAPIGHCLITTRHNVTGLNQETGKPLSKTLGVPDRITITHNDANAFGGWTKRTELLYDGEQPRWHEHPGLGAQADFVALPLSQVDGISFVKFDLLGGDNLPIRVIEQISVVGFPFGLQVGGSLAIWATGYIASEPDIDYNDLPLLLIDCRTREGQSGSPVIAYRPSGMISLADGSVAKYDRPLIRFLGVYSGRVNSESDLGSVWKASALIELIQSLT